MSVPEPALLADGFRDRGASTTRLEAFVDAAFAFAVTLLVIAVDAVPHSVDELVEAMKGVPAFAASFALIADFWYRHNTWSRRYGLDDGVSILLSLILVFLVLVYVYPLKMLFGAFFTWISNGYLPAGFTVRQYADMLLMFMVYAVAYSTLSFIVSLLYAHAWRQRRKLRLSEHEAIETYRAVIRWRYATLLGGASLLVVGLLPPEPTAPIGAAPGLIFFASVLTSTVQKLFTDFGRRQLARDARGPA